MSLRWQPAVAGLILAAGAVAGAAVPAAASATPTSPPAVAGGLSGQEFVGLGAGVAPGVALRIARADARRQAIAAGYQPDIQCVTTHEDVQPPTPPDRLWIAETDLFCL
jgi:hypothetical protein